MFEGFFKEVVQFEENYSHDTYSYSDWGTGVILEAHYKVKFGLEGEIEIEFKGCSQYIEYSSWDKVEHPLKKHLGTYRIDNKIDEDVYLVDIKISDPEEKLRAIVSPKKQNLRFEQQNSITKHYFLKQ